MSRDDEREPETKPAPAGPAEPEPAPAPAPASEIVDHAEDTSKEAPGAPLNGPAVERRESKPGPEPAAEAVDDEDFTSEKTPAQALEGPMVQKFDPEKPRETMRGVLALLLTVVFSIVALGAPLALVLGADVDEVKSVLEVILPPIVALTGTAIGFYFSGRT